MNYYSFRPWDGIPVNSYGFLSFTNIGKNVN